MHKCCIVAAIINVDTKQQLNSLLTGINNKLIGREELSPGFFSYHVLGHQGNACIIDGEEVLVTVFIVFNGDVPSAVLDETANYQSRPYRQVMFNPPETRAVITERLRALAGQDGCERAWVLKPGDPTGATSPANLLSKFDAIV